jgi:hypothetical protein
LSAAAEEDAVADGADDVAEAVTVGAAAGEAAALAARDGGGAVDTEGLTVWPPQPVATSVIRRTNPARGRIE